MATIDQLAEAFAHVLIKKKLTEYLTIQEMAD